MNIFSFTKFIANVSYPIARMLQAPCLSFKARANDAQTITLQVGCPLDGRNITLPNDLLTLLLGFFTEKKDRMNFLSVNKPLHGLLKRPETLLLPYRSNGPLQDMIEFAIKHQLKIKYYYCVYDDIHGEGLNVLFCGPGTTILNQAIVDDDIQLFNALLRMNFDIEVKDSWGYTPLHLAIMLDKKQRSEWTKVKDMISELLNRGATVPLYPMRICSAPF